MRIAVAALSVLVVTLLVLPATAAKRREQANTAVGAVKELSANSKRTEDEKAIRKVVDSFVEAYNQHNAAAIAALFTNDGMTADEQGNATRGRAAIEKEFAEVFKEHPKTQVENTVESIRFVGSAEAVENGMTSIVHDKKLPPEKSRYRVIHVKRDGKWQMASATDMPEDAWTGHDQLAQLEGMVGEWVNENPDSLVLMSYRWTDNHRFILGKYTVQIGGKPARTGSDRIGWDPLRKTIRSWMFDSEGGFAEGTWSHDGKQWVVTLTGVTRDGKPASSTHTIAQVGKDQMNLQSIARIVGNEKKPDGEKIHVVRRPPEPK